jgi:hypothetical protein
LRPLAIAIIYVLLGVQTPFDGDWLSQIPGIADEALSFHVQSNASALMTELISAYVLENAAFSPQHFGLPHVQLEIARGMAISWLRCLPTHDEIA